MGHLRRRLILIAIALALVLTGGTIGFVLIEHYPVFDAFYMTLTTVTTVGYAEIRGLSHAGRVFNSFLIFFGVTTIFLAVGAMTQTAHRAGAESILRKAACEEHDRQTGRPHYLVRFRPGGARRSRGIAKGGSFLRGRRQQ